MGTGNTSEYVVVHRVPQDRDSYLSLVLIQDKNDCYAWAWEDLINVNTCRWMDLDGLAFEAHRLITGYTARTFVRMGHFLREFVGEARYILVVLEHA